MCGGEGGGEWGWLILELEFAGAKMGVANHGNSCHFFKSKHSYLTYTQPLSLNNQCKIIEYSNINFVCKKLLLYIHTLMFFLGYLPNFKPRVAGY